MNVVDGDHETYDIYATASLTAQPPKVLKHDDLFAVFDHWGDCGRRRNSPEGLYFNDTRYVSRWDLRLEGERVPLLLSSTHDDDGSALTATLANPTMPDIAKGLIGITRTKFLWSGCCYERISLRNYDVSPHDVRLDIQFEADFKDLFEVRGTARGVSPQEVGCRVTTEGFVFEYTGLDRVCRSTEVTFRPLPHMVSSGRAHFDLRLPAGGATSVVTRVRCADENSMSEDIRIVTAYRAKRRDAQRKSHGIATVASSNSVFNKLISRCTSDVYTLLARTPLGLYPHAGIPWYSTVFGRDGIITALFMLWVDPTIALGVLRYLAATQATSVDPLSDAEPGKIVHEQRRCEMANTGEVPFGSYYGTVDATPLFVILAGAYWRRTGDRATIRQIWPNIQAALGWCELHGDRDGDGFVAYNRCTPTGLVNQGWKDSHDAVFHNDGRIAGGSIALVEVQAYVHQAYEQGAKLGELLGNRDAAERYRSRANALKSVFHDRFWNGEIGTYVLALDGEKCPCRITASNAGHVLMSDLAPDYAAQQVGRTLMATDMWSGWGVRTLATGMPRYNPMSYHNGSIWPHDNALIAIGLARYGMKREASRIFEGLYAAQSYQADNRLPELFCGTPRRKGRGPVSYPVSCSPQAWAAAAPFALISACLGLDIDHENSAITFKQPILPEMTQDIRLSGIRVGHSVVDVRILQSAGGVAVDVVRRVGDVVVHVTA
jgi:glycogen debranching enzyme